MANTKERACFGKKVYRTEELALKAEKVHVNKYQDSGMNHYKCKFCPYYHIGHRMGQSHGNNHRLLCPTGCGRLIPEISLDRHVEHCLPPELNGVFA